ncbi:DsbA family protein [Agrobacterium tumefaciens]|uniref:DsbA family protein n=1 Tax=Agrobacterium tumefaciens TaxID=358 RepID=UPI0021CE05CC|nr:thioredoxin domain-containing protein [Agrobacterium tumefaciens]UXS01852.1 DsbA family protein [Agrobacterium tumefaciens]HEE4993095.1 DsbA family protein [Klebsiella pneumoniae]
MPSSLFFRSPLRRQLGPLVALALTLLLLGAWYLMNESGSPVKVSAENAATHHFQEGPPWRYGSADARFTLILYADLECPYCKSYYPIIKAWVDRHPEANLQWHHLPLPMHEPAATRQARLAECAGEAEGHTAFWQAVTWIYQHTRSDGAGIPDTAQYPALTPAIQTCQDSKRTEAIIQAQTSEGWREGFTATPTLKLRDNQGGRTLALSGPVEGDALLSALDLLSADHDTELGTNTETPSDAVDNVSR